ncbi:MraY family glycosyltransferase [Cytophagaceae bacterium DM2B3-1]|uniref:MraY family glycosyltransferase n=1 Tax=Xanthocytophaga flava TaxID=3048013 RepID=A0ABT7CLJ7_9BACT|nr:MraY family glycosyltransferase [Xanthocytophaga flavus]MDJ1468257.1 MraY family glycosyltransferase [Xanthocytophaga flavus]MDJ1494624.1 MraY family glycosyltransferase [Xanthocytophaga flavus]
MDLPVNLLLAFLWAFVVSVFAIPSIVQVAHAKKLLNEPNGRSVHALLTPRLGGMAIFAGFISALAIFGRLEQGVQYVLAGAILLFFIGLKDDIVPVSAFKKFFVQLLATGIVIFMGDVRISNFHGLFGLYELEIGTSYAFTIITIIGITNAINLIDGLDGLAGTTIIIITIAFGSYFYIYDEILYSYVAASLIGGTVGFLRYNFHRAIIFMGDAGSLTCGFIVAVMAVHFAEMPSVENSPMIAIGILYLPVLDTLRVAIIRILNGQSPFAADKNHIHHCLIRAGLKQLQAVSILAGLHSTIIVLVVLTASWGMHMQLAILGILSILISFGFSYIGRIKQPETITDLSSGEVAAE